MSKRGMFYLDLWIFISLIFVSAATHLFVGDSTEEIFSCDSFLAELAVETDSSCFDNASNTSEINLIYSKDKTFGFVLKKGDSNFYITSEGQLYDEQSVDSKELLVSSDYRDGVLNLILKGKFDSLIVSSLFSGNICSREVDLSLEKCSSEVSSSSIRRGGENDNLPVVSVSSSSPSESISGPECSDGLDNDEDGLIDWQEDLSCTDSEDDSEESEIGFEIESNWTVFQPSSDSRIIFVSSSDGDNDLDGYCSSVVNSTCGPKQNLTNGIALMRQGYPDWVLLKRGDVWTNETFGTIFSGRSYSEKSLVGSYGNSSVRPLIITNRSAVAIELPVGNGNGSVSILGVHLSASRNVSDVSYGIRAIGNGSANYYIEDVKVEGYTSNIIIQGFASGASSDTACPFFYMTNLTIRRSVVLDSFSTGTSQGLYTQCVFGNIILEENVFDNNGWKSFVSNRSVGSRNIYLDSEGYADVFMNNNIITMSDGAQMRSGGVAYNNYFDYNTVNLMFGYNGDNPRPGGVTGNVSSNVVLHGTDFPGNPRGWGIRVENINSTGAVIENNIIAHDNSTAFWNVFGISLSSHVNTVEVGVHNVTIKNNIVYNLKSELGFLQMYNITFSNITIMNNSFQNPKGASDFMLSHQFNFSSVDFNYSYNNYNPKGSTGFKLGGVNRNYSVWISASNETFSQNVSLNYTDPSRTAESYVTYLGVGTNFTHFSDLFRNLSKFNWEYNYTSSAINNYIRSGFCLNESVECN